MYDQLSQELDFHFKRNGSLVLCFNEDDIIKLEHLLEQEKQNSVPDLKILNKEQIREIEPNISDDVYIVTTDKGTYQSKIVINAAGVYADELNNVDIEDKLDMTTTKSGLDEVLSKAGLNIKSIPHSAIIASFSGLRASTEKTVKLYADVKWSQKEKY